MLADYLLGCISLEPPGADIPRQDPAFRIKHEDGVVRGSFDQQSILLGQPPGLLSFFREFRKRRHLCSQDDRNERLAEEIHGAEQVTSLQQFRFRVVGSEKDDGRMAIFRPTANQLGRLESVQALHLNVQQHDGKLILKQTAQSLFARSCFGESSEIAKDSFESQQIFWSVIHEKNVGPLGRQLCQGLKRFHDHVGIPLSECIALGLRSLISNTKLIEYSIRIVNDYSY